MPQILSFGDSNPGGVRENPIKKLWERFRSSSKFTKSTIFTGIVFLLFVIYAANNLLETRQRADSVRKTLVMGVSLTEGVRSADSNTATIISAIDNFSNEMGRAPGSFSIWTRIGVNSGDGTRSTFPNKDLLDYLNNKGITPVVFMEVWGNDIKNSPESAKKYSNSSVAGIDTSGPYSSGSGSFDDYFKIWGEAAKADGRPIILRFNQEMNGCWFPWSPYTAQPAYCNGGQGYHNVGNTPENFKEMWRHVYKLIKQDVGAENVKFLWAPSAGGGKAAFFPGNEYIDFAGFDSYIQTGTPYEPMLSYYRGTIEDIKKLAPGKPIIIAETGIAANKGAENRKNWIKDGYPAVFNSYPEVAGIIYFNLSIDDNWLMTGDMKNAYAQHMADLRFQGNFFSNNSIGPGAPSTPPTQAPVSPTQPAPTGPTSAPPPNPPTSIPGVPMGYLDTASTTSITGWACDSNNYSQPLTIHFYADAPAGPGRTPFASTIASIERESAVGGRCGGNKAHGFSLKTPDSLKDGKSHKIYAYAINIPSGNNPLLTNSPLTLGTDSLEGKLVLTPTDDITLWSSNETSPNSRYLYIDSRPTALAYMRFNLSQVKGKTISKATLRIKVSNLSDAASNGKFSVKTVSGTWAEKTINYSTRPTLDTMIGYFSSLQKDQEILLDVTSYLRSISGDYVGFGIDTQTSNGTILFSSEARDSERRPRLEVEYR